MNKMKDFLIEIGVEELPAGCLENATSQLKTGILELFKSNSLSYKEEPKVYYTPRRLAVLILNIPDTQEDKKIEVFGPPKELSFNPDGTMTQATIGFANSQGVPVESIKTKAKGKKEVICCEKTVTGKPTIEILKSSLPDIIKNIKFKKSMKWEPTGIKFARPIRWFVALFGEDIIEFELAGVKSGRISQGLRGDIPITIDMPDKYEQLLEEKGIIADSEKRKERIIDSSIMLAQKNNLDFKPSYTLIEEVTNLVESPKVILCEFNKRYLNLLPPEVITTAMRVHQRYFHLEKNKNEENVSISWRNRIPKSWRTDTMSDLEYTITNIENLSNYFIVVANTIDEDMAKIREGNVNILKGRLEDAEFFYNEDLKIPLEDRVEKLKHIVWQAGLETLYDKTQRLVDLSEYITAKYNFNLDLNILKESATLCLADLATNMIKDGKEFTSLEGLYGAILAEKQNKNVKIVDTLICRVSPARYNIQEFPEGVVLAIANRIDTIVAPFIINKIPTGSSDPFGIRQATNELITIILKNELHIQLKEIIRFAIQRYHFQFVEAQKLQKTRDVKTPLIFNSDTKTEDIVNSIHDFIIQRVKTQFENMTIRYDIVNAVLSIENNDIFDAKERGKEFFSLLHIKNQDFMDLVMATKRIRNILKNPEFKVQSLEFEENLLKEPKEKELWDKFSSTKQNFDEYVEKKDYQNALNWLLGLAPLINNFFDKILIMAEDINLRNNRLALINLVNSSFEKIADFSQIAE
ncbi:MAG: glycine--tRNA ligase subunit beta [bacterium]